MKTKRAQVDGGSAASLIFLILGVIILYILFIPPAERERLLEGTTTPTTPGTGMVLNKSLLLLEHPGKLSFLKERTMEHTIPDFFLLQTSESKELKRLNTVYITTSSGRKTTNRTFGLENLESLENVMLSFQAKRARGILTIKLNNEIIYENELREASAESVSLPKELLSEQNFLEFSVSDSSWPFRENVYSLESMKITADVTDMGKQKSNNIFYISPEEAYSIEKAYLYFLPTCKADENNYLEISINGMLIFSGMPECGSQNKFEFSREVLKDGNNYVLFQTKAGSYTVEQIKVRTNLKENPSVVYYFSVTPEQQKDIQYNRKTATLVLEFVDDIKDKEGEVIVNGHRIGFFTKKRTFEKVISGYIQSGGNNAVEVIPKSTMEIVNLYVKLQ